MRGERRLPFTRLEAAVVASFAVGLAGLYLSMPASDYSFLKLPRTLEDLPPHPKVLMCYFAVYIFMQPFMIPGTVFLSMLAGPLFGVVGGMVLVVLAATIGFRIVAR